MDTCQLIRGDHRPGSFDPINPQYITQGARQRRTKRAISCGTTRVRKSTRSCVFKITWIHSVQYLKCLLCIEHPWWWSSLINVKIGWMGRRTQKCAAKLLLIRLRRTMTDGHWQFNSITIQCVIVCGSKPVQCAIEGWGFGDLVCNGKVHIVSGIHLRGDRF